MVTGFTYFSQRSAARGAGAFAILECLASFRRTAQGRIQIKRQDFEASPPSLHPTPRSGNAGDPDLPSATATANYPMAISVGAVYGRDLSDTTSGIKHASSHRICEPRNQVCGVFLRHFSTSVRRGGPYLCFRTLDPLRRISSSPPISTDNSASK